MNPPFSMIHQMAQDREDEIRKTVSVQHGQNVGAQRPRLQVRLAHVLRAAASRLDGESGYGRVRYAGR